MGALCKQTICDLVSGSQAQVTLHAAASRSSILHDVRGEDALRGRLCGDWTEGAQSPCFLYFEVLRKMQLEKRNV